MLFRICNYSYRCECRRLGIYLCASDQIVRTMTGNSRTLNSLITGAKKIISGTEIIMSRSNYMVISSAELTVSRAELIIREAKLTASKAKAIISEPDLNTSLDCQSFLALQTNGLRLTFRAAGDFMISPPLIRGYAALG